MRTTAAMQNFQMQEFCQKLFDKVDPLGYDVTIIPQGETIWLVRIENAFRRDQYSVEWDRKTGEWSWIRWML